MESERNRDLDRRIESSIVAALLECASKKDFIYLIQTDVIEHLVPQIADDLLSFSEKDPAAHSDPRFILTTYTSFAAVLHYRISHWVHAANAQKKECHVDASLPALLARRRKMLSGAEIHYNSTIGKRFVLDHGYGTVIGQTSVIGDDCYMLGGVTLGARGICRNSSEPRHPVVGHRVQIGAFSSLLGRIQIGNDVFIGPNCIITNHIPSRSRVKLKSYVQITSPKYHQEKSNA